MGSRPKDPWTFKAATDLGAEVWAPPRFADEGSTLGRCPRLSAAPLICTRGLSPLRKCCEASLLSEPLSPRLPDRCWGRRLGKICWFEKFKSDFVFSVKRIKIQHKLITGGLRLFWEVAIKGFILFLSLLPLQPAQVCKAIKPSPSPQPREICPAPFLLQFHALGKKRKLNLY